MLARLGLWSVVSELYANARTPGVPERFGSLHELEQIPQNGKFTPCLFLKNGEDFLHELDIWQVFPVNARLKDSSTKFPPTVGVSMWIIFPKVGFHFQ